MERGKVLTQEEIERLCQYIMLLVDIDRRIKSEKNSSAIHEEVKKKNDAEWEERKKILEERWRIEQLLGESID